MKAKLILLGLVITLTGFSQPSDSVLIIGQAISKDKQPLPGVTVRVSNTEKVVYSDAFGKFELWSPIEGIMEFSCISEPYRISVSSVGESKANEVVKFEFDLKQPYLKYKTKKIKGRTIKVNPGRISDIILAYYKSDFERITKKYYDYHLSHNHKMVFIMDGQIMDAVFNPDNLDYSLLKEVAIIRIINTNDKIIFLISTKIPENNRMIIFQ
jgi:hypothetical protein